MPLAEPIGSTEPQLKNTVVCSMIGILSDSYVLAACVSVMMFNREHLSQDQAQAGAGDTMGSDEPAVDWGRDVEESDRAVAEVKSAAKQACIDVPAFRLKRQDMGDSADSRFVIVLMYWGF